MTRLLNICKLIYWTKSGACEQNYPEFKFGPNTYQTYSEELPQSKDAKVHHRNEVLL
jgi:hypothetical protein